MGDASQLTVFVNERAVTVHPQSDALAAIRVFDPALADAVIAGRATLTDGRGIACEGTTRLAPGAILRVVISARRQDRHADA